MAAVNRYGISEIYAGNDPSVDLVLIHGLNGHPRDTWAASESNFWPQDLLPRTIPNSIRILTYGYNSTVGNLLANVSSDRIHHHAQTLVQKLFANRSALNYSAHLANKKVEHLRSIFISTSGIIFLSTPHHGASPARWQHMLQSLYSAAIPNDAPIYGAQLIGALQTQSATLQDINLSFTQIMGRFRMFFFHEAIQTRFGESLDYVVDQPSAAPVFEGAEYAGIDATHLNICRFESKGSPGYDLVAEAIKRWAMEAPDLIRVRWEAEQALRRTCIFFNIHEFITLNDGGDELMAAVKGDPNMWLAKVPTEKKGLLDTCAILRDIIPKKAYIAEGIRTMLLSLISTFDVESQHRRFRKMIHRGTCRWILENPNFEKWFRGGESSCLWCSGIPGAGKTVLTSVVIHHAKLRHGKIGSALAFFYCTSFEPETLAASTILGSFMTQLVFQFEKLSKPLPAVLTERARQAHDERRSYLDTDELIELLLVLAANSLETYFILDGLDECISEERETVLSFFKQLLQRRVTGSTYRILISSRDEVSVSQEIPSCIRLPIRDIDMKGDIREYVCDTVDDLLQKRKLRVRDESLVSDIKERLISGAQGMFLWVKFQISDLCNEGKSDFMIKQLLDTLPKGLNETYRRCLEKIKGRRTTELLAREALKWVIHAKRPLHVEELEEAVAFGPGDKCWDGSKIPKIDIVSTCANLVILDETEEFVRLAHHTVKEFLFSKGQQNIFYFDFDRTNLEIGESCIRYLSFSDFRYRQPGKEQRKSFRKYFFRPSTVVNWQSQTLPSIPSEVDSSKYRLLDYVRANWAVHTVRISEGSPLWDNFRSLVLQQEWPWTIQHPNETDNSMALPHYNQFKLAIEVDHIPLLRLLKNESPRSFKNLCKQEVAIGSFPLHSVAKKGSKMASELLLQVCNVNECDTEGRTALHWAAEQNHEEIVRLLLAKRAKIDRRDSKGRMVLHVAAERGHEGVVRLLVEKGADVNAKNGDGWAVLRGAARFGHGVVARLPIEKGADIDAKAEGGWTVLHGAAENGHEALVQLLIENGIDVNMGNGNGWTALHLATLRNHEVVVRLLVEKSADIDAKTGDGLTALCYATLKGHEAVARLLIENGADISAGAGDERAVLHWATLEGHEAVVRLLIEKGADIDAKTRDGRTALHRAILGGHEAVARLLIEKGADIDTNTRGGLTALHCAALKGHDAVARLLIKKGADIDARAGNGRTVLHWATLEGHEAVARLLIEKGADIDAKTRDGQTTLHVAAQYGYEVIVQLLIENGADVNAETIKGETALHFSNLHGYQAVGKLLKSCGARP